MTFQWDALWTRLSA
ncbi:hypothetical protein LEMLEM_LOCUS14892 [Lemmus lemmus]